MNKRFPAKSQIHLMNSRAIAAIIIYDVFHQHQSLSDVFETRLANEKDAAFIKALCFGTIRFWFRLEAILNQLLKHPFKPKDHDILCLLMVGLYQLLYLDTPSYAAINETVSATRQLKKSWASGLVNKILRMVNDKKLILSEFPQPEVFCSGSKAQEGGARRAMPRKNSSGCGNSENLEAQFSHPRWMIEKIKRDWPNDWGKILLDNNQQAPLFIRVNLHRISMSAFQILLEKQLIAYQRIADFKAAIQIIDPMPVEKIPGFSDGFFSVQDISGQKVLDYLTIHPNYRVLDACAAPGGKLTHILETYPTIKKIVAVDVHQNRLQKIADNFARLQLPYSSLQLIPADVTNLKDWWDGELFDRILVDAPCSATGVIRRHPDIKLLRKESDIAKLASQQLNILNILWDTLAVGGQCIYTTCSIFKDENERVLERFTLAHHDARILVKQQILTGDQGCDGFFYGVIEKKFD